MSALPRNQVAVLVPAAGRGERLGLGPKAGLELGGRPLLDWVVDKALQVGDRVIVACMPGATAPSGCTRIEGGPTRQDSVLRLVRAADRPWLVIWDAARPFGSVQLALAVLEAARETGAAGAFIASEVPVAVVQDGWLKQSISAASTALFQTPQAFAHRSLLAAMERALADRVLAQSALELMLRDGHQVRVVPGEKLNLKLTTAEDWLLSQSLLGLLK